MELFEKMVNGIQPSIIFTRSSILDVRQGSKYDFLGFFPYKIYKIYFAHLRTTFPFFTSEAVVRKCSVKKLFLKISQNSREKNLCQSLFLKDACFLVNFVKFWRKTFLKERPWHRCFSVNFVRFSRTLFL